MSTEISRPVSCPRCGTEVNTQMSPGINAEVSPNLRTSVLRETLFNWTCPKCSYVAQLVYPCLYHDKGRKFMVYLVPSGSDEELAALDMETEFPQLNCVKKRTVTSLAALKEKILIFEAGLDDCAVEMTKLALSGILAHKTGVEPYAAYFSFVNVQKDRIGFAFYFEGDSHPVQRTTQFMVYERALEVAQDYGEGFLDSGFSVMDSKMAQLVLEAFQND